MSSQYGAIVLCGGASSRMGCDKASLPFGPGEVMLQRVVRLVGAAVPIEQIVCVAAAGQSLPTLPPEVQVVRDAEPYAGPLAGLAGGLAGLAGRAAAVFVCGCDAPRLVPAFVMRMFDLLAGYEIAAPHDGQQFHPLAAVYRTDLLPVVQSRLALGDGSLQSLLKHCNTLSVPVDDLRRVDPDLGSLESCNSPADYQRALALSGLPYAIP